MSGENARKLDTLAKLFEAMKITTLNFDKTIA